MTDVEAQRNENALLALFVVSFDHLYLEADGSAQVVDVCVVQRDADKILVLLDSLLDLLLKTSRQIQTILLACCSINQDDVVNRQVVREQFELRNTRSSFSLLVNQKLSVPLNYVSLESIDDQSLARCFELDLLVELFTVKEVLVLVKLHTLYVFYHVRSYRIQRLVFSSEHACDFLKSFGNVFV